MVAGSVAEALLSPATGSGRSSLEDSADSWQSLYGSPGSSDEDTCLAPGVIAVELLSPAQREDWSCVVAVQAASSGSDIKLAILRKLGEGGYGARRAAGLLRETENNSPRDGRFSHQRQLSLFYVCRQRPRCTGD
jgi:hypothetical protein